MSPRQSPAALVGVAVDVSGSMQTSMRNRHGASLSRFQSFQEALGRAISSSRQRAEELARNGGPGSADALIFAYAFGMSTSPEVVDLLALLAAAEGVTSPGEIEQLKQRYADEIRRRYSGYGGLASLARSYGFGGIVDQYAAGARASAEEEVRGKIKEEIMGRVRERLAAKSAVTLTLTELAQLWSAGPSAFENTEHFIFGSTPMRRCLEEVADRFAAEARNLHDGVPKFLVLVSDGEPTDGDPRSALERIRGGGVFVASCLVTDADVTKPRHLYAEARPEWDTAARLMFEAASAVEEDDLYRELLEGRGWSIEPNSHIFIQINHPAMMDEFFSLAFSRTQGGPR
jgi:hypothetical protein